MRVVALVSGGKDSCFNMMQCIDAGHTIVALANLQPHLKDEMDSYMYQTVGHQGIDFYAEAMELPLYREVIKGEPLDQSKNYKPTENDEVEDLYRLLSKIKDEQDIEAVAVGAILSDYQRIRVENVCKRLDLISLAYLWRRNQKELLQEMITSGVEAVIIKVAALGLDPRVHLGLSIRDIQPHLLLMHEKYGLNVCGEGGEYETFTLNCPLFKKKLVMDDKQLIIHSNDAVAPVGYLNLKLHLEDKSEDDLPHTPSVKNALDFIMDLSDSVFSDISDIELSESELESIEKLEIEEKKKQADVNPLFIQAINEKIEQAVSSDALENQNDSSESVDEGYNYDHNESERQTVEDHSCIYGNRHGWYFIGGIVGEGMDTSLSTENAMKKLFNLIATKNLEPTDICSLNIYMRDMGDYEKMNKIYVSYLNFPNPPTRVCVQCPLPHDVGLIIDGVAHKYTAELENDGSKLTKERVTMHVQGISHWAPANIGPYSQAIKVGEVIGTCGQIALVPGSMQLVEGGTRRQCALALRHLTRVIRAMHAHAHIRSVVQSVCYVSAGQGRAVREARRQLERRTAGAIVQYAVVEALPRGAAIEWHAWAHTDNKRFEYEETGCNVGEYKVAITRRWNYENTVAAFVCYVATGSSPSTCQLSFPSEESCFGHRSLASQMSSEDIEEVLEYSIRKLLNECHEKEPEPAVKMRIFYQVWSAPPVSRILTALSSIRQRVCPGVACTIVPVVALHNAFTFLSISGLRFDE